MERRFKRVLGVFEIVKNENQAIVKFNGGLGNQMFQWAFGYALSKKNKCQLLFDMSFFEKKYARPFELDIFSLNTPKVEDFLTKLKLKIIWKLRKKLNGKNFLGLNFYSEPHFHHSEDLLKIQPPSYIEGFFQSEKYFAEFADEIRENFKFKNPPDKKNIELIEKINETNSISLHIRRGDYVQKKRYQNLYATCTLDYYKRGVEYIAQSVKNPTLFVFSDDIQWVKENLNLPYESVYVSHNTGDKSYEDMRLMSKCKHNIIANSSFSWWGAWLNNYSGKIVIAPQKWFNDDTINQDDVIPEDWTKLKN